MILATACFDGLVRIYIIKFNYDYQNMRYNFQKCDLFFEITITEDSQKDRQHFKSVEDLIKDEKVQKKDKEKLAILRNTALDHRHPNAVVFDITGRLYIGDSLGYIHIWLLSIDREFPKMEKIKIVTHKELEYGTINKITIVPNQSQKLIVHTRDNCIRLIDISKEKTSISLRFFGLKCWKTNIKSTCSPDGSYLFSGSEEGEPKMWQLDTGISFSTSKYECGFIDSVNDVSWNEVYNMNALSGFGQEYPLLVYVFERKEPLIIEDEEIIGKEKMINNQYAGSGIFKPMIEDTKALKEEENMFNTKFNINNNYMNNNINPFLNSHINNNNHINNMGNDDELNNILPDDYMKKADKVN
jgi:WD40 repeat protein